MYNPVVEFVLFGFTVANVLADPRFTNQERDLSCVELWSGCKRIATTVSKLHGGSVETMDIEDDPIQQDLSTQAGFEYALNLVMRVTVSGLLTMAPVCSSFGFPNMSHTGRNKHNYSGDESYEPVRQGNAMARVAAFLLLLGQQRLLFVLVENPSGSMFFNYVFFKMVVQYLMDVLCDVFTVVTPHCAFTHSIRIGNRAFKPFKLLAIGGKTNWVANIKKRCPCGSAGHKLLMPFNKSGKPTGNEKKLKGSQAYSPAFGKAIVREWLKARKATNNNKVVHAEGLKFTALSGQLSKEEATMEAFWNEVLLHCNEHESGGSEVLVTEMSLRKSPGLHEMFSWKDRSSSAAVCEKGELSEDSETNVSRTGSNKRVRENEDEMFDWRDRSSSSVDELDWRLRLK